jgi:hypothetical protein
MKALEIYKYIKNNNIEWHWINEHKEINDVVIFPYYFQLDDFNKLLSNTDFDDGGIECNLMNGYVAIKLRDLFESHDIELSEIFPENEDEF